MDILRDQWIPTDKGVLSPIQALEQATRIVWARADWNSATMLLLHAIAQTGVVLKHKANDREAWCEYMDSPPSDLSTWIDGLDVGPDPWQCPTAQKSTAVYALFPESPGDNALKKNSDITMWRESAPTEMTYPEAMIAVIADQFWGLASGAGHRSGCRGQNPLTLMVEPDHQGATLWERTWLNILPKADWDLRVGTSMVDFNFPWKKSSPGQHCTPKNTHPLEMLWQMPRRWSITQDSDGMVRHVALEGGGIVYEGWKTHPLTPYKSVKDKPDEISTVKAKPRIGFTDWAALAVGIDPKAITIPIVVNAYIEDLQQLFYGKPLRLRCFGWSKGDFGPAAWIESVVPFYPNADHAAIEKAVSTAKTIQTNLFKNLKSISTKATSDSDRLYQVIEKPFFVRVNNRNWSDWENIVRHHAREIFWDSAELNRVDPCKSAQMARYI